MLTQLLESAAKLHELLGLGAMVTNEITNESWPVPQHTMDQISVPILNLRMRPSTSSPFCSSHQDQHTTLDTLAVMTSQDSEYKCSDYLAKPLTAEGLKQDELELTASSFGIYGRLSLPGQCLEPVDECCREKMCEWTYRVCDHFHSSREIAAYTFSLLDRFVDRCSCDRTAYKLAAMTCMYMATKIFNSRSMSIASLAELSRGEFEREHIKDMERVILHTLEWRLNPPTVQSFIDHLFVLYPNVDLVERKKIYHRATFFAELSVFDYGFVTEVRYLIAVACVLNATEGVNDLYRFSGLHTEFLNKIQASLCVDLDLTDVRECQIRLWQLYSSSLQSQYDHVLVSSSYPKERYPKDRCVDYAGTHSPVSVDRRY